MTDLLYKKLEKLGQTGLLNHPFLSKNPRHLLRQVLSIDEQTFYRQKEILNQNIITHREHQPLNHFFYSGHAEWKTSGNEVLKNKKVGCIIMAGGQGSRLRFDGPKGSFPISPIKNKSLFQIFAEKTLSASLRAKTKLPLAIMTSPENDEQTRQFFISHQLFGLEKDQLSFYIQEELPLLDLNGNLFLENPDCLAMGPKGNGSTLHLFYHSKLWQTWHDLGVEAVCVVPIDNALADPFDSELIGAHFKMNNDITAKSTLKKDPFEKVGLLTLIDNRVEVVEYTELSEEDKSARNKNGDLVFNCANLSMYCIKMDFISDLIKKVPPLTLHRSKKTARELTPEGISTQPKEPNAWKFEEYIFDVLPYAKQVEAIVYPRENIFAPLKNFQGEDSIESVRDALQKSDIQTFCAISGIRQELIAQRKFELSQEFYYPTPELLQRWKGRVLPERSYIEGST